MILGVDVDDTVADFTTEWVRRYNMGWNDSLTVDDIRGWEIQDYCTKAPIEALYELLRDQNFYQTVSPLRGAREGIYSLLAKGHRIVYVSSCPDGTMDQKREWLVQWGFLTRENRCRDFIAAEDKSLINVDVLFDDRLTTVENFPRDAVLVNSPANLEFETKRIRISGMKFALNALYALKYRF